MKQYLEVIKRNWKWIILVVCIIVFILIAKNVFNNEIMSADVKGYDFISKYLISDYATPIVKFITNFGGATFLIAISISLCVAIKNKKICIAVVANLIIISILNFLLKGILQRPRPIEYRIIDESGYSFPSGHSAVSMAFYGFIIYLIYRYIKNKYIKWTLIIALMILIIAIGISRIYLGVHYTSDVIGGFLVAISYLILFIKGTELLIQR